MGRYARDFTCTQEEINLGDFLLELCSVPLRETSGDHEESAPPLDFQLGHTEDFIDRFLPCRQDEGTGIDDDNLGIFRGRDQIKTGIDEGGGHYFPIDQVFWASQIDDMDGIVHVTGGAFRPVSSALWNRRTGPRPLPPPFFPRYGRPGCIRSSGTAEPGIWRPAPSR